MNRTLEQEHLRNQVELVCAQQRVPLQVTHVQAEGAGYRVQLNGELPSTTVPAVASALVRTLGLQVIEIQAPLFGGTALRLRPV